MTKYTKEQLNGMLVEKVRSIAKNEFKLALSSQGKRFTKPQLIETIVTLCNATKTIEVQEGAQRKVKVYTNNNIGKSSKTRTGVTLGTDVGEPKGTPLPVNPSLPVDQQQIERLVPNVRKALKEAKSNDQLKQVVSMIVQQCAIWTQIANIENKNRFQKSKIDRNVRMALTITRPYAKKVGIKL